ncbi:hypothetical protein J6590_027927 [Homalodisca vitripennis]|nr:hypothetical protein J6590_027927 [Homalodisca vitripennis]
MILSAKNFKMFIAEKIPTSRKLSEFSNLAPSKPVFSTATSEWFTKTTGHGRLPHFHVISNRTPLVDGRMCRPPDRPAGDVSDGMAISGLINSPVPLSANGGPRPSSNSATWGVRVTSKQKRTDRQFPQSNVKSFNCKVFWFRQRAITVKCYWENNRSTKMGNMPSRSGSGYRTERGVLGYTQFKSELHGESARHLGRRYFTKHCTLLFLQCMRSDNFSSPRATTSRQILIAAARATFDRAGRDRVARSIDYIINYAPPSVVLFVDAWSLIFFHFPGFLRVYRVTPVPCSCRGTVFHRHFTRRVMITPITLLSHCFLGHAVIVYCSLTRLFPRPVRSCTYADFFSVCGHRYWTLTCETCVLKSSAEGSGQITSSTSAHRPSPL